MLGQIFAYLGIVVFLAVSIWGFVWVRDGCTEGGFHIWTKWSDPTGVYIKRQTRHCTKCNRYEEHFV